MAEADPRRFQHIFLDVVGFTKGRSVEAQTDIVEALNGITVAAVQDAGVAIDEAIFLPTGDGLCVALPDTGAYDQHLSIAVSILSAVAQYNEDTEDEMRQFELRIGLNENVDNAVADVNGNRNVAGAGINLAQRIMSSADAGQIMVGEAVHGTLSYREQYFDSFRPYQRRIKHGEVLTVYQYLDEAAHGLNTEAPEEFMARERMSEHEARYIANALVNRDDLMALYSGDRGRAHGGQLQLHYRAYDDRARARDDGSTKPILKAISVDGMSFREENRAYEKVSFWIKVDFAQFLAMELNPRNFEQGGWRPIFVSAQGRTTLQSEWPELWNEYDLDSVLGLEADADRVEPADGGEEELED